MIIWVFLSALIVFVQILHCLLNVWSMFFANNEHLLAKGTQKIRKEWATNWLNMIIVGILNAFRCKYNKRLFVYLDKDEVKRFWHFDKGTTSPFIIDTFGKCLRKTHTQWVKSAWVEVYLQEMLASIKTDRRASSF